MECLVEYVLNYFFIVSGSCLVSRQLLSSAATAATKVVGHWLYNPHPWKIDVNGSETARKLD